VSAPRLSVVIPTLNEGETLRATIAAARSSDVELVVVDGGSTDGTLAVADELADRVLTSSRGRAIQLNAGARATVGDVLLFLHADTLLPTGYVVAVRTALADPACVGGRFDVTLDADGKAYRVIERLINLRSRLTGIATGDQAMFVQRAVFDALGGFPNLPLMEDLALSRKLKQSGHVAALRARVVSSARRWQRHGVVRTVLLMWLLRAAYYLGVSPLYLARIYSSAR